MDLAAKLDPAEVLAHLNQLGYHDITPHQLKEFTEDLKKLIIYDHLSSSSSSFTSFSTSSYTSEQYSLSEQSGLPTSCTQNGLMRQNVLESRENVGGVSGRNQNFSKISSTFFGSDGRSTGRKDLSTECSVTKKTTYKENKQIREGKQKREDKENLLEAMKQKTSFIRPWQLQGVSSGTGRAARSDPVSLYHYYQTLWSQQKCPGEDNHSELRWVIREKMLGQDPHLYGQNVSNFGKKSSRRRM